MRVRVHTAVIDDTIEVAVQSFHHAMTLMKRYLEEGIPVQLKDGRMIILSPRHLDYMEVSDEAGNFGGGNPTQGQNYGPAGGSDANQTEAPAGK